MDKSIRPSKSTPRNRVLTQLETYATVPNPKYGDSFRKVKGQIPGLLTSLGLQASPADIRAASILSRNGIDINADNLSSAKELDGKLAAISGGLHPQIAVSLITEGQNPLEMPLDDLRQYIDGYGGTFGTAYSSSDVLDSIKNIEPIIRSAIISLYKAIRIILRYEGATLGYALKRGSTKTLGALLSAASAADGNLNLSVDDNTTIYKPAAHEKSIQAELARACAYGRALLTT